MPNRSKILGVVEFSAGAGAAGASEAKGLVALAPSFRDRYISVSSRPISVSVVNLVFLHRLFFLGEKLPLKLLINVRGRRSAERGASGGQNVNCRLDVHPAEK